MDVEAIVGLTVSVCALVLMVPLLLVYAGHKVQLIEDAWRKLAERHGLRFEPGRKLTVRGELSGRSFAMAGAGAGNNAMYTMELELHGPLPAGLNIKVVGKHKRHQEVMGEPVATVHERTGRIDINEEVRVGSMDPGELPAWLTPARKRAALSLADAEGELDGRKLKVNVNKKVDDLEYLDDVLRTLCEAARALDARPQRPGMRTRPRAVASMLPT